MSGLNPWTPSLCAIRTVVENSIDFHPMTDKTTAAVMTGRGECDNRAFKTVEDRCPATHPTSKVLSYSLNSCT